MVRSLNMREQYNQSGACVKCFLCVMIVASSGKRHKKLIMEPFIVTKMDAFIGLIVFCIIAGFFEWRIYLRKQSYKQWVKDIKELNDHIKRR